MTGKSISDDILKRFVGKTQSILRDNLVGIYLHGSVAMGCYNPAKSDLDLIVVVHSGMTDPARRSYMDMVTELDALLPADRDADGHHSGIEMSVVLRRVCKPFVYPTPFELHYSRMHFHRYMEDPDGYVRTMRGTDKDLAAHFTIIRRRGRCLCGEPTEAVFGEVPGADYLDSIRNDVAGARDEITENTMYLTLNLARMLAYRSEGVVLSKKEGGEWGLKNLPPEYHPLLRTALEDYENDVTVLYDPDSARRYAEYMLEHIFDEGDDQP